MTPPADSGSFRSDDGRVEVVFDLDELPESKVTLVMKAAVATLDAEHNEGPGHVTVMVTGDERIRELNGVFKGEDKVTDVLSFNAAVETAFNDGNEWREFYEPGDMESGRLGDVAISLPQVVRQASEAGKSVDRELAMLTVHGVLHLLGYDHAGADEEKVMFGKTDVVLAGIFGD